MEENVMSLNDYIEIMRRRKWSLILPAMVVFLAAAAAAFFLPPIYKSTAKILIEEAMVSDNIVPATITGYAELRIQAINRKVMRSEMLKSIIENHDLYKDEREKYPTDMWPTEEIVDKLREDIQLEPISVEVVNPRTGRPTSFTTAFTLSYEGKEEPETVKKVVDIVTSSFLKKNIEARQQKAKETAEFLAAELDKANAEMENIEAEISAFKEKHNNELPELINVNMRNLDSTERNIMLLDEQLWSLKQREGSLQTQLDGIPPDKAIRLNELKIELTNLKSRYSDQYPDVIKLKKEIAEFEKQHVASVEIANPSGNLAKNPSYISLEAQLSSTKIEIKSIYNKIEALNKKRDEYRRRIENMPNVEKNYRALTIQRENILSKIKNLTPKLIKARVAQGLEKGQKGERFTLIEPANLPIKPYKPNRAAILLIGLVLGIGAGVGTASIKEYTDTSVRSAESLAKITSIPVLATIPEIKPKKK